MSTHHQSPRNILFLLLAASFLFVACKKEKSDTGSITIHGKSYATRSIGGKTWTLSNYEGPGGLHFGNGTVRPEFGRYYSLAEMQALALPAGWRMPTEADYRQLCESQGVVFSGSRATGQEAIKRLLSQANWLNIPGSNASGFNAQPAGYMFQDAQPIPGDISEFWTAEGHTISFQEGASGSTHNIKFYQNNSGQEYRFNIRLVRD
ncbi:MAG TPA: FISUMP domain-containing protein [Flavisolibacter sp.]|nr:FISUMP domain-containing protein [Flavisolibacter sp.]